MTEYSTSSESLEKSDSVRFAHGSRSPATSAQRIATARCLDVEYAGFHQNSAEDWTRGPTKSKFLVFQARMTWVPAAVALAYPRLRKQYQEYVRHGLKSLADNL